MNVSIENGNFAFSSKGKAPSYLYHEAINLSLNTGEVLTILGPNGVGKTTLLRCMVGLLPWSVGTSAFNNVDIKQYNKLDFWRGVGYVPIARKPPFDLTLQEFVVLGRASYIGMFRQPSAAEMKLALDTLDEVGIAHLAYKKSNQVSSGELQLASIARTLISAPKLLLLDEPESHLDIQKQVAVLQVIKQLSKERGITSVINTHYPSHAFYLADKVLLLGRNLPPLYGCANDIMQVKTMSDYFNIDLIRIKKMHNDREIEAIMPLALAKDSTYKC